jgi:alcohol dehydrogenase YqhD (iron-dependent ADH family)
MNKRVAHVLWCMSLTLLATGSAAQSTGQQVLEDEQVAEARELLQAGRDEIVESEMQFTEAEGARFWPLYQEYRAAVKVVRDSYVVMVADYVKAYDSGEISDEFAENLLNDWLDYNKDLLNVQQEYVKKFKKVLPIRKVVRFFQLENKIDAEINAELAMTVPLME